MAKCGEHALVLGGSMGGMLAARALAGAFDRVTLVERDRFPADGENRKGVPQGRHAHALLCRGAEVLEDLFPGLLEELVAKGAMPADPSGHGRWVHHAQYLAKFECGLPGVLVSRPLLEACVRGHARAIANVQFEEDLDVLGLVAADDGRRIRGARVRDRASGDEREIAADFVVDATGRGSRAGAWLEELGYERPVEDRVEIKVGYTTCLFRRRPTDLDGDRIVVVAADPPNRRFAAALAIREDTWIVTVGGYLGEQAPDDLAGFIDFAAGLPSADVAELVRTAAPLDRPVKTRADANVFRRFDRLSRFPDGFLVFGDALCHFNPIYGQGMTVAALEADALRRCVERGSNEVATRFFAEARAAIAAPWTIAVGNDLRFPEIDGPRDAATRFTHWYMERFHRAASHDPVVALQFLRVANLLAAPTSLLAPHIAYRVWRGQRTTGRRASSAPPMAHAELATDR